MHILYLILIQILSSLIVNNDELVIDKYIKEAICFTITDFYYHEKEVVKKLEQKEKSLSDLYNVTQKTNTSQSDTIYVDVLNIIEWRNKGAWIEQYHFNNKTSYIYFFNNFQRDISEKWSKKEKKKLRNGYDIYDVDYEQKDNLLIVNIRFCIWKIKREIVPRYILGIYIPKIEFNKETLHTVKARYIFEHLEGNPEWVLKVRGYVKFNSWLF